MKSYDFLVENYLFMKTITRSGLAMMLALALVAGSASVASAKGHDDNGKHNGHKSEKARISGNVPFAMRLQINMTGKVDLQGTVQTIGANSFTVNTWGGTWVINTASTTKYTHQNSIASIRVGDVVRVNGKVSTTTTNTVLAKQINNKTYKKNATSPGTGTTTTKVGVGTVASVGTSSLVVNLYNSGTTNIQTSSSTIFLNKLLSPISFSQILVGHAVAVSGGVTAHATITPAVIQDLSF